MSSLSELIIIHFGLRCHVLAFHCTHTLHMFCIEIANSIAFLSRNSGRTLTMTCNGSTCIPATHVRRTIVPFDHTRVTKLLPQYKQRRTASRRSSTSQFRATGGSQAGATTFRLDDMNALRLHPRQVRTIDVERMKDVMLQRSKVKGLRK